MANKATYDVQFKRRSNGKTNYKKRLALVKSGKPRLVVRKTNSRIIVQIIAYERPGDKVIVSATSVQLKKYGWAGNKNIPSAYLTGLLCGMRAKEAKINQAVLDIGFRTPVHMSVPFAALKGALDAGLDIPFDETALPKEDRITGKHIENYANSLDSEEINKKFSKMIKNNVNPKEITKIFQNTKEKIVGNSNVKE
ncbi:MAG: 50S ribosomal protein L18 [Candidatus Diapherotrites archaeon]